MKNFHGGRVRIEAGWGYLLLGINGQSFIRPNSRAGWGISRLDYLAICQGRAAG